MKYLIVVDMQNDFIDGSLGTAEAQAIVPAVCDYIKECSKEGFEIITTQDTHPTNYLETQEGRRLPVKHCIEGTHGWEINEAVEDALKEINDDKIIKLTKATFGSSALGAFLGLKSNAEEIDEVHLIGLCTDICVISNAVIAKAALPEARIVIKANACAGVTPASHEAALNCMKTLQMDIE